MIYFLFFLSIGLITILALLIKKFQNQKLENSIATQKLKEADSTIKSFSRIRDDLVERDKLIRQLNHQIATLRDNKSQEIFPEIQRLKESDQKGKELEQIYNEITVRDELIRNLNSQIEALRDEQSKLQQINNEKENTIANLYDDIEKEIEEKTKEYKAEIKELRNTRNQPKDETQNKSLDRISERDELVQLKVLEHNLYPNEIIGILIDVLRNSLINVHENSRRQHIIADIIRSNESNYSHEEFKTEIQSLFRDYRSMTPRMRHALERMGFTIVSENSNYKIIFHQDSRYIICFAKTPSDWRAGRNIARDICNLIL